MNSLLVSKSPDQYQGRRHLKRSETRPVLPRHLFVLELHLAGHEAARSKPDKPSIQELTDYSPAMIYRILADEQIVAMKQQVMAYYDSEFEALYPKVVHKIREALESSTPATYMDGAKTWLKAHGKLDNKERKGDTYNLTAEDIAINILNQARAGK